MSRSDKARHGMKTKHWKDSVLASRSQKRAWTKRKRIRSQQERSRGKAETRKVALEAAPEREVLGPAPSIPELRKEARRVAGPKADVYRKDTTGITAGDPLEDGFYVELMESSWPQARRTLMTMLKALPTRRKKSVWDK